MDGRALAEHAYARKVNPQLVEVFMTVFTQFGQNSAEYRAAKAVLNKHILKKEKELRSHFK